MSQMPREPYPTPLAPDEDRTPAIMAHLSAPIAAIVSIGWLSMVGPLIVWFLYRDSNLTARRAAAGAFNFNLSFWLLYALSWILIVTILGAVIGIPLLITIFVVAAYCHIKGAIRASRGQPYDYPFQIPVLS